MAIVYISGQGSANMQLPAEDCVHEQYASVLSITVISLQYSHISSGQSGGRLSREPLSKKGPISWLDMPA